MAAIRGTSDAYLQAVKEAIERYEKQHPGAEVVVYRQSSVSIRVRIVDPDFAGMNKGDRHNAVWHLLNDLPEDVQSQVSVLLLLAPEETNVSFANYDFEHPLPSGF